MNCLVLLIACQTDSAQWLVFLQGLCAWRAGLGLRGTPLPGATFHEPLYHSTHRYVLHYQLQNNMILFYLLLHLFLKHYEGWITYNWCCVTELRFPPLLKKRPDCWTITQNLKRKKPDLAVLNLRMNRGPVEILPVLLMRHLGMEWRQAIPIQENQPWIHF